MKGRLAVNFFIFSLLAFHIKADATKSLFNQFCGNTSVSFANITDTQRADLRAKGYSYFFNVSVISGIYQNPSSFKNALNQGALLVVSIILMVVAFITIFILLCFCCCCDKPADQSEKYAKCCTGAGLIFLITTIAMFVIALIYMFNINGGMKSTICSIGRIPYDFTFGYTSPAITFIGLNQLSAIITNLSTDLSNLQNYQSNFQQIVNFQTPVATAQILSSLNSFYNKYNTKTTNDGTGTLIKPQSVQSLTTQINQAIGTEITIYDTLANMFKGVAQSGINFTSGNSTASTQASLVSVTEMFTNLSSTLTSTSSSMSTIFNATSTYLPMAFYVSLGLGLFLVLLLVLAFVLVCTGIQKTRNVCRCGVKLCLFLVAFFVFIITIVTIVVFVLSFVSGTLCGIIPTILSQTSIVGYMNSINLTLFDSNSTIGSILDTCLSTQGNGDLTSTFLGGSSNSSSSGGSGMFSQAQGFLTNISQYNQAKANFSLTGPGSLTINATSSIWRLLSLCQLPDQPNAVTALANLNTQISCGGKTMVFNLVNCTTGTCEEVQNNALWTPPTCVSNSATIQTSFNNLRTYCSEENSLINQMIADANGTASSSINSMVVAAKQKLNSTFPLLDTVIAGISNTINSLQNITNGFGASLNCTIIRQELLNFEAAYCFDFTTWIAMFSNFLAFFALFCILTVYLFCCGLRSAYIPDDHIAYETIDKAEQEGALYEKNKNDVMYQPVDMG